MGLTILKMRYLFLFGMYRSGTTTLSKAIDCIDSVIMKNDPLFFLFKSLRNSILAKKKLFTNDLFGSYIFNKDEKKVYKKIQEINLKKKLIYKKKIIKSILINIRKYQPDLEDVILNNSGKTYSDFIKIFFKDLVKNKKDIKYCGIKEVWLTEFYPSLKKEFKNSKFIFLIRDPRAVVASSLNNRKNSYDIQFLVNQWRKISILSKIYKEKNNQDIILINYENFVLNFDKEIKRICNFLNLKKISSKKIIHRLIEDKKWEQNSTYSKKKTLTSKKIANDYFDKNSINMWEKKLTSKQIKFIEFVLHEEMKIFDYKPKYIKNLNFNHKHKNEKNLKFLDEFINKKDKNNELYRKQIIHKKKEFNDVFFFNNSELKFLKV